MFGIEKKETEVFEAELVIKVGRKINSVRKKLVRKFWYTWYLVILKNA